MHNYFDIVVEDVLSQHALSRILSSLNKQVRYVYGNTGCGFIDSKIEGFNHASKHWPVIVLRDLDHHPCPGAFASSLLPNKHPTLIFRIVVREVEAWLLADRAGFSRFIGVKEDRIPTNSEDILNPKEFLIELAKSGKRSIRDQIVPDNNSAGFYGKNYNGCLIRYIHSGWDIENASQHSRSLTKLLKDIRAHSF